MDGKFLINNFPIVQEINKITFRCHGSNCKLYNTMSVLAVKPIFTFRTLTDPPHEALLIQICDFVLFLLLPQACFVHLRYLYVCALILHNFIINDT